MSKKHNSTSMQVRPKKTTQKGVQPRPPAKPAVPGSGRNRPAKGYNQETHQWERE